MRLGRALPSVTISLVQLKPSDFNFSTKRVARRRLKSYSGTLRALIAPSDLRVCPTSTTRRNFAGSHFLATGFGGGGTSAASGLTGRSFATADCNDDAASLGVGCLAGTACL